VWKKIAESEDLIVFERQLKNYKLKIEARKNKNRWEVFKTKVSKNSSNLISEHTLKNKKQALQMINKLKTDKNIKTLVRKKVKVSLKRVIKEDYVEKWVFYINKDQEKNFLIVKFDTKIKADLVVHEKYQKNEDDIINQVEDELGLRELGEECIFDIYYFKKYRAKRNKKNPVEINYMDIDIEFDFDEDYY